MSFPDTQTTLFQVQQALEHDDLDQAIQILQSLRPADQAEIFEDLNEEDQASLLPNLATDVSADILEYDEVESQVY